MDEHVCCFLSEPHASQISGDGNVTHFKCGLYNTLSDIDTNKER